MDEDFRVRPGLELPARQFQFPPQFTVFEELAKLSPIALSVWGRIAPSAPVKVALTGTTW